MLKDQALWESNAKSYPRKNPIIIKRANNIYLTDINGKQYIDCLVGAGSIALGHNNSLITDAIRATLDKGHHYIHWIYLLKKSIQL